MSREKRAVLWVILFAVSGCGFLTGCQTLTPSEPELPVLSENPTGAEVLELSIIALGGRAALL